MDELDHNLLLMEIRNMGRASSSSPNVQTIKSSPPVADGPYNATTDKLLVRMLIEKLRLHAFVF